MNQSINLFSENILKQEVKQIVISGYSIWSAIYLVLLGTKSGPAQKQILDAFNITSSSSNNTIFNNIIKINKSLKSKISNVNCMFVDKKFDVNKSYTNIINKIGIIKSVNFPKDITIVNKYIAENTDNRIKNILDPSNVDSDTVIILVNAIYFKGIWKTPFKSNNTKESIFYKMDGTSSKCMMMNLNDYGNYYEDGLVQVFEKDYENNMAMGFILTSSKTKLNQIFNKKKIYDGSIINLITKLQKEKVNISIPVFKQQYKVSLVPLLKKMGITDIFDKNKHSLANISLPKNIYIDNLYVTDVIHEATVEVNELGTKAAAATVVVIGRSMMSMPNPEKPKVFKADRSFIWYIRDLTTDIILFSGIFDNN